PNNPSLTLEARLGLDHREKPSVATAQLPYRLAVLVLANEVSDEPRRIGKRVVVRRAERVDLPAKILEPAARVSLLVGHLSSPSSPSSASTASSMASMKRPRRTSPVGSIGRASRASSLACSSPT